MAPSKLLPIAGFLVLSVQLLRSAETPALIERPTSETGPTQVSVGIWIVDISNIDSAQQTFTADIAIVLRWKDARLAHTGTAVAHYGLDQIWTPRTGIANETNSVVRKLPESAEVEPDGTVTYRQRYVGLTKCDLFLMRIGCATASKMAPASLHLSRYPIGQLKNGKQNRAPTRSRPACSFRVTLSNSSPPAMCSTTS
jgi:hypothetical protein